MENGIEVITENQTLTAKELAAELRISDTLVRKMARTGMIPARRIRNGARSYFRFRLAEVEEALANEYKAPPQVRL